MKKAIVATIGGTAALLIFTGSGCMKQLGQGSGKVDKQLANVIKEHSLTGDPSRGQTRVEIDSPLAQLGMKLFFSKSLSVGRDTACVSCHHPFLGGGDGLPIPVSKTKNVLSNGFRALMFKILTAPCCKPLMTRAVPYKLFSRTSPFIGLSFLQEADYRLR